MPFCIDSVPGQYKTHEMCDKAVDVFLPALKFIPDLFVVVRHKKLDLFSDYDIIFLNEDSSYVTFFSDEMAITSVDLHDLIPDDVIFDKNILKLLSKLSI